MNKEKTIRLNFGDKECLISPYEYPVTPEILRHYKKTGTFSLRKDADVPICPAHFLHDRERGIKPVFLCRQVA